MDAKRHKTLSEHSENSSAHNTEQEYICGAASQYLFMKPLTAIERVDITCNQTFWLLNSWPAANYVRRLIGISIMATYYLQIPSTTSGRQRQGLHLATDYEQKELTTINHAALRYVQPAIYTHRKPHLLMSLSR